MVGKWFNKLGQIIAFFGKNVSWLSFLLVVVICIDVIFRYIFNFSVAWVTEIEWHFYGLLFLFGSNIVTGKQIGRAHV